MTEYLAMVLEHEAAHASEAPGAMADRIAGEAEHAHRLSRQGKLKDQGRLRPSAEGKRVRKRGALEKGAEVQVEDGPFSEEGRALTAYQWIEAASAEEAAAITSSHPLLPGDRIELRPVMKGRAPVNKDARPGKIFACAVLGSAPTEEVWTEVMDRIDRETGEGFPSQSFLGGLRLRSAFDGPFLETKEIIGGLFFLRMSHLREVIAWAKQSRFVVHGTLEIRELWRS